VLSTLSCIVSSELTIQDVVQPHRMQVLYEDKFESHRITVRRGHILEDAISSIRGGFDEKKHIRVSFLGEPAVDEGGPRREFFMLVLGAIANNGSLLQGPADRRVLRHNTSAFQVCIGSCGLSFVHEQYILYAIFCLICCNIYMCNNVTTTFHVEKIIWNIYLEFQFPQDELYLYVGKFIALSILHGGPGPVFFAPVIVDYLFGGMSMVKPEVADVPDALFRSNIEKVGFNM